MKSNKCFTLFEIMIAVAILGLLFSFAIPAVMGAFGKSKVTRFINDLKIVSTAYEYFNFEKGYYPPDASPGQIPDGMSGYLRDFPWGLATCIGGKWDWENNQDNDDATGIAVQDHELSQDFLVAIDKKLDDGDISSGQFTATSSSCLYVLN